MFDFGDDLVIESYRIPWLIWIQIVVMFLLTLTIVLSYFGFLAPDSSLSSDGDSLTSSSTPRSQSPLTCSQTTQVVAANHNARGHGDRATSPSNRTREVDNSSESNSSSTKDLVPFFHPCRYLDLAKQAFLKCLGLGSSSHRSPTKEHED